MEGVANRAGLGIAPVAGSLTIEEIRQSIGADSLGFVSLEGLIAATTLPAGRLCLGCFTGDYPIPVTEAEQGKHMLEAPVVRAAVSLEAAVAGGAAIGGSGER